MHLRAIWLAAVAFGLAASLSACGGGLRGSSPGALPPVPASETGSGPIKHVVIVIQENRSFDDFFATFPGADGTKFGKMSVLKHGKRVTQTIKLQERPLDPRSGPGTQDLDHTHNGFEIAYDGGKMDGFNLTHFGADGGGGPTRKYTYQYVNPAQIQPYWDLAKQYVLADHLFQTQSSGSFTAHQDLIAGGTALSPTKSIIDNPTWFPWGCDAPPKVLTATITSDGVVNRYGGPFPCLSYATMRDLLDAKHVSWKYYAVKVFKKYPKSEGAGIWSAFDAIDAVRHSPEWGTKVPQSNLRLFTDISKNQLPAVSWVTPDGANSDHLSEPSDTGPSWVAQIVNAVGKSPYWNSTAIIILWDDWGGFYDHVKPPQLSYDGLGFRVPMIVVSPYVKPHVSHTQYEFGSILKFIEGNWNLGSLGTSDARATSIGNVFSLHQAPRKFKPISAKYSKAFFLHQKPSGLPVDTE